MINRLVLENLKHRPLRTFLTALSIGFQVTMILTLVGVSHGMLEDSKRRARGTNADIFIRPPGTSVIQIAAPAMSQRLVDGFFLKQPHVVAATGTVMHAIGGIDSIQGIDLDEFTAISGGFRYLEGGPFAGPFDCIVDQWYAEQNKIHIGTVLRLANKDWRVSGIVEPGKLSRIFVPRNTLQELIGATGKVSQIYLKLDDPSRAAAMVAAFKANEDLREYRMFTVDEMVSLFSVSNVPGLRTFIYVIIGLSVIVGFLVVSLTMYAAVLERTREIGILKALGAHPREIMGLLARETFLLAVTGWLMGLGLSAAANWAINRFVGASIRAVTAPPEWWLNAFLVAVAAALLGAIYPGLRAARHDAIEALAYD